MYQLEVKRWPVAYLFPVAEDWDVTVDIDSMERGEAGQHPPEKKAIAAECETWLRDQGVKIVKHPLYAPGVERCLGSISPLMLRASHFKGNAPDNWD
jgi:hypothetical protein